MSDNKNKSCCCDGVEFSTLSTIHGTYTTIVPQSYKERTRWERPDPKKIHSYIPGTITEVTVKVGDSVEEGDKLLQFNAMKMSNTLKSPLNGVIKSVLVNEGDAVPNGALLVEFE